MVSNKGSESIPSHHVKTFEDMGTEKDSHEYELIDGWRNKQDERSLKRLLDNHEKLVKMVANGYRGYGLCLEELISEGHVGLMHAVKNFDIERGFKFSTYAVWWIKAAVQEYIFRASSLLTISATKKHKRLFFKLRSFMHKHGYTQGPLTETQADHLAELLEVTREDILTMHSHLTTKDLSTNETIKGGDEGDSVEWQDWIQDSRPNQEDYLAEQQHYLKRKTVLKEALNALKERERMVFFDRRIKEPPRTLEEIGKDLSISKERVRQIEEKSFEKIQTEAKRLSIHHGLMH